MLDPRLITRTPPKQPLFFGEVLFDCFPNQSILGGAPFNAAWNLKGLGGEPLMITAVGGEQQGSSIVVDSLGQRVLDRMNARELGTRGVQILPGKPTGRVDIRLQNGSATYQFLDDVAFDNIALDAELIDSFLPSLLYHGSLALRGAKSRDTLFQLKERLSCPVFVDINLRLPHYDFSLTEKILTRCHHLKLNHDELVALSGFREPLPTDWHECWHLLETLTKLLKQQYQIENVWLTAAEHGAAWMGSDDQLVVTPAPEVSHMVDTVGAGDATSAVIIHGLHLGQDPKIILTRAVQFASRVCQIPGAVTDDPQFYDLGGL